MIGIAVFALLRWLAPMHAMGWDEAYYLGVGANLFAGRGLETVFGGFPSIHSPLWPIVLQAPSTSLGIDATTWGHLLAVLTGGAVIGMTAWFAWRSVRLAAPVAAAFMLAYPFLADLAGWMGLDLPAAALAMLYIALGISAVRRGSMSMGFVAGLVFAAAFLIKELALPFAPIPILAGLVRSTRMDSLGRGAAGILLAAVIGTSWWFVVYAVAVGGVYRLGTPTWTLIPIGVGAALLVLIGATIDRIAPRIARWPDVAGSARASRLGWGLTVVWALILLGYFAVAPNPIGTSLLDPVQIRATLARSVGAHLPLIAIAFPGAAIALAARLRSRAGAASLRLHDGDVLWPDDQHAVDDLIVWLVVGAPFVFLVIAVGEGPRHYIALLGALAALAAIGWTTAFAWAIRRVSFAAPAVVMAIAILVLSFGAMVATAASMPTAPSATDVVRASVVRSTTSWVREHLPPGSTVVFGSGLAMETGLQLLGDYRLVEIQRETAIRFDPAGPVGLRASDGSRPADWTALWTEGRDATALFGYRADPLVDLFRHLGPAVWIETVTVGDQSPSPQLEMLGRAGGVQELARWSWPSGESETETVVYRVDPSVLSFSSEVAISTPALTRLLRAMERDPGGYRAAASTLLDRARVAGPPATASALLERLRAIAGR